MSRRWWPFLPAGLLALAWVALHFTAPITVTLPDIASITISERN